MKKSMKRFEVAIASMLCLFASTVALAQTIDIETITFNAPTTGGIVSGYNLYVDDCAATGATGAPIGTVTSGGGFTAVLDGTPGSYELCVRPFNSTGEQPDPAESKTVPVVPAIPGPISNLEITIVCRDSGGNAISCESALGVTVTVQ